MRIIQKAITMGSVAHHACVAFTGYDLLPSLAAILVTFGSMAILVAAFWSLGEVSHRSLICWFIVGGGLATVLGLGLTRYLERQPEGDDQDPAASSGGNHG